MLTPPPPDDRRRTLTAVAVHGLSCLHGERRGVTMEGLRLFGAFRGQQRRSTSTAERSSSTPRELPWYMVPCILVLDVLMRSAPRQLSPQIAAATQTLPAASLGGTALRRAAPLKSRPRLRRGAASTCSPPVKGACSSGHVRYSLPVRPPAFLRAALDGASWQLIN